MKEKPDKLPSKGFGLTWGRRTESGLVTWRLFRRDRRRLVHQFTVQLGISADASFAARQLRIAKRRLRDQVDEVDLKLMECTA